jgi:hypothetical protein
MKSRRARWLVTIAVSAFAVCGAGAASAKDHERGHAPATGPKPSWSSVTCPDQVRPAPKPAAPAPEVAPKRVRPPASLPCCNGADCSCSGPPALAAAPRRAALPRIVDARIGTAARPAPTGAS